MGQIITPKTYIEKIDEPIIFLGGPIRGASLWQDQAIDILLSHNKAITIVNPRRELNAIFSSYKAVGRSDYFERQRAWERHYLEQARTKAKKGAVMFWLPGEVDHNCEKAYGAMTRIELGQEMTHYSKDKSCRLCIGTDEKFSEFRTIKYDLDLDAPEISIKRTLEETCKEALRLATQ